MTARRLIWLAFVLVLAGCAASGRQTWYKPGGTQREFDIDARECEVIARQQATAEGERGQRYAPEVYAERYEQCLGRMGWSRTPPAALSSSPGGERGGAPAIALLTANGLEVFGARISLPAERRLLRHDRRWSGPTLEESFFFRLGAGQTYLNVIAQQSEEATFLRQDYPAPPPYRRYASGRRPGLRWTALWARLPDGGWVKAIGGYGFFGDHQRLSVVITAPLAPPAGEPPAGLSLAANQHQELSEFVDAWQPWIESLQPPASFGRRLLEALGRSVGLPR